MNNARPSYEDFVQAIDENDIARLKKLLAKAGPNVTDEQGFTPLMYALEKGKLTAVELLMANGADTDARTEKGTRVDDFIRLSNRGKVIDIYKKYGKKINHSPEASWNIGNLLISLGYTTQRSIDGICYGLMGTTRHYLSRGEEGIQELKKLYALFSSKKADELKEDIEKAEKARLEVISQKKSSLLDDFRNQLLRLGADQRHSKMDINPIEAHYIIDMVIKKKFDDTSEAERKRIVDAIIQHKFTSINNRHLTHDQLWLNKIDAIWPHVENLILDAQVKFLVQRKLKEDVDVRLKKLRLDPLLLELRPFLQSVALYQGLEQPVPTRGLLFENGTDELKLADRFSQLPLFTIFSLVSSKKEEKQGLVVLHERGSFGVFDLMDLESLFTYWRARTKGKHHKAVSFQLSSLTHSISAHYLPDKDKWILQDNTEINEISGEYPSTLASEVFKKLPGKELSSPRQIVMRSFVFTDKENELSLKTLVNYGSADEEWDRLHKFTDEKLRDRHLKDELQALFQKTLEEVDANKKLHDAVEQSIEARWPSTNRYVKNQISKNLGAADQASKNDPEQIPLLLSINNSDDDNDLPINDGQEDELFSLAHANYCQLKKAWERIWSADGDMHIIDQGTLSGIKKPGFFDWSPKAFGYHEHYKIINDILNLPGHEKQIHFEKAIKDIDQELTALLNCKLIKLVLPEKTYHALERLSQQLQRIVTKKASEREFDGMVSDTLIPVQKIPK